MLYFVRYIIQINFRWFNIYYSNIMLGNIVSGTENCQ